MFFDAAVLSAHAQPPPDAPYDTVPVHVAFVDWLPGILSIFGLLIVNLIDKERLIGDGGAFGDGGLVWRARLFLFMGFALMAGGLAGSVVRPPTNPFLGITATNVFIHIDRPRSQVHSTSLR